MRVDSANTAKIRQLRLMTLGSWIFAVALGGFSLLAKHYGRELLGDVLLGASVLFGLLFAFYVIALMAIAIFLMHKRASSDNDA